MATGGYRGGSTTDFLEEWKARREKLRAKQAPGAAAPAPAPAGLEPHGAPAPPERPPAPAAPNCVARAGPKDPPPPPAAAGSRAPEPAPKPPAGPEEEAAAAAVVVSAAAKGKGSGPSARKGKGQIEKRKLREKRRSTGVVNIPAAEVSPPPAAPRLPSSWESAGILYLPAPAGGTSLASTCLPVRFPSPVKRGGRWK